MRIIEIVNHILNDIFNIINLNLNLFLKFKILNRIY